ncbi:hypothetical protein [Psychrobacter sp. AOP31-A1-22]|uniref:hypothetical protein n=1 Tax=Psychrobacter sp. AOP31-A1-22 TaxID=3457696 RepID=UPI0040373066
MNNSNLTRSKTTKKIVFNSRYKGSLAFKDAMVVIKACGLLSFYNVLYDTIAKYLPGNDLMHASTLLDDLDYLTPKTTNVNDTVLNNANRILENTIMSIKVEGYNPDVEFEDQPYQQQVFFCLTGALSFLATIQRFESSIANIELHSAEIVEQQQRLSALQEAEAQAKRRYTISKNPKQKRSL